MLSQTLALTPRPRGARSPCRGRARRPPSTASRRSSPKAGATVPAGKAPTFKMQGQGPGPGLRPRLQVQGEGQGRRDLQQGGRSGRPRRRTAAFSAKLKFFDFPEFWLNTPGHLLLAGATASSARGSDQRLPAGGPDRQVQGDELEPVRIGCSGWNYASWRETFYPPGLPARRWLEHYATLFDTVEVNATFYRLATPVGGRRLGAPDAAGLRVRGQGEPLHDPHEAAARHGARRRRASTTRSRRWSSRPSSARCCGSCPTASRATRSRARARARRTSRPAATLRVPPPELVRRAGAGICCASTASRSCSTATSRSGRDAARC